EELQKQVDQLFEFIQKELSKMYEGEELRKAIVSVPKRKVVRLEDILKTNTS
ncbi:MAG TPA: MerR family transcriptional regulator, partial [Aquifex aeolicus]|nr:MerR family transcriptional regulator [Aquifex aeolicus]